MLRACVDRISSACFLEGWACIESEQRACIVGVYAGGSRLGVGAADNYRPDVLAANIGHGFCGFSVRLSRSLPAGPHEFRLVEETLGVVFPGFDAISLEVPQAHTVPKQVCEELIGLNSSWTDDELGAHLGCLKPDHNFARMGAERFVDVVFMYLLNRRADQSGQKHYVQALISRELSPTKFISIVLRSDERKSLKQRPPGPYDYRFPFELVDSQKASAEPENSI